MTSRSGPDLLTLLGERAFVALAEAFGGTRLYVPATIAADHRIARAIGSELALELSRRFAGDYLGVPLAREERARHYRAAKHSNPEVARLLGISESGVKRLFKRTSAFAETETETETLPLFPGL